MIFYIKHDWRTSGTTGRSCGQWSPEGTLKNSGQIDYTELSKMIKQIESTAVSPP